MTQNFLMSIVLLACVAPAIQAADFNNNTLKGNIKNDKETVLYDSLTLDQVVVTATHTPKALKDVPVVTRLISLDDIKKTDATNIQDLLVQELPGLEFGFAMSQETSLNMSGFGGNAVLFLVDGERVAGETVDNTDYNRLNLDNVGRIEIVKGASSALYGSNAVGGVINIITRESSDPWTANVNSRYSSFGNEWRNGAGFSFNSGKWNSQTNFQHTDIEPIKLASGPTSEEKALAALLGQTIEEDKSNVKKLYGQESYNVKERITFTASDFLRFIARGGYFYRESQRDTYNYHFNAYSGGLKAIYDWRNGRNIEVSYAYDQYDKANFTPEGNRTHDHDYRNAQHTAHAVYNHTIGEHVVTLGSDLLHDYLSTYQFLDNTSHEQSKRFNVVGSVRYDYFSASGADALTARLAAVCKLDGITLRANYASGFRAPSLKEMYMHFDMGNMGYIIMGNPDVKPEKSNNFNVAIELGGKVGNSSSLDGKYNITLMGYCNIFDKRITSVGRYWVVDASHKEGGYQVLSDDKRISEVGEGYVFTADDGTKYEALTSSLYWNEDGVRVFGLDLSAQYRFDFGLALRYNYAYMHESGNVIDTQFSQPRTHSMTWRIDYDHRYSRNYAIGASLSGRYLGKPQSGRKDVDQGYTLWKLMFQQHILKGIHLNLAIDNILNYKPKAYYYCSPMTTGTTYSVGLSVDIDRL